MSHLLAVLLLTTLTTAQAAAALPAADKTAGCPPIEFTAKRTLLLTVGAHCFARRLAECTPSTSTVVVDNKRAGSLSIRGDNGECRLSTTIDGSTLSCSIDALRTDDGFLGRKTEFKKAGEQPGLALRRLLAAFESAIGKDGAVAMARLACQASLTPKAEKKLNNSLQKARGD